MRLPIVLLALASCGRAIPAPAPGPEPYPLFVGAKWTYRSELGLQVTRHVRSLDRDAFELVFSLPIMGEQVLHVRRTPDGVVARRGDREQTVLRFPMRAGDSWRIDFPGEDLADCTVEGEEELEILGRKMSCTRLKVLRTSRKNGSTTTDHEWYAAGIGLVQMRVTVKPVTQTFVLKSFEP